MKISENGLDLIKKFEGCRLVAYKCPAGVLTIGYGHTGSDVKEGMKITQKEADALLKKDVAKFEKAVMKYNNVYGFNQNQFDALVSFAFNIGSIDQLTAKGTRSIGEIGAAILLYNKAGGKKLEGLVKRREAEQALFLKGTKENTSATEKYQVTASALNCRDKASMSGKVVGAFANGAKLTLIKKVNDDWFKVKGKSIHGKTITGFCCSAYLKKV